MAGNWPIRRLADLCESVDYGYTTSAKDIPCGPKFLRITDIVSSGINWDSVPYCEIEDSALPRFLLNHGDIVIARTGATTGYSAYIANPPDAVFASYLVRMKIGPEADSRFIAYFLKSSRFWDYMRGVMGDKSAQPNASAKTITQVKLKVPSLKEQKAIAHILGTLDDKIELNRRMNETLEGMARAIFKSWFVDFDPVHAKAEGRPTGLPPEIDALFPESFQDSELGEIPKGWEVFTTEQAVTVKGGSTPRTNVSEYWENGTNHWATPKDLSNLTSPILIDTERKITDAGVQTISSRQMPKGTLLLSSRAPVGYLAISTVPISVNQGFIAMVCTKGISNYFMLNWCFYNMERIKARAGGTTFQEISKRNFRPLQMVRPPKVLVESFSNHIESLYQRIRQNEEESISLRMTRDTLLPKLLSGQLRIPDTCKTPEDST